MKPGRSFNLRLAIRTEFNVADGFTNGLLKLYQGKNLRGINQIAYLSDTETPEEQQQWQQLRQNPEYWQALYPFPYENTILKWSKQRQLNPLLVTSLIRQESRFEKEIKSSAGAMGLMQVIPPTAKTAAKNIGLSSYSMRAIPKITSILGLTISTLPIKNMATILCWQWLATMRDQMPLLNG